MNRAAAWSATKGLLGYIAGFIVFIALLLGGFVWMVKEPISFGVVIILVVLYISWMGLYSDAKRYG